MRKYVLNAEDEIVIAMYAQGKNSAAIARALNVGGYTVRTGQPFSPQAVEQRLKRLGDPLPRLIRARGNLLAEFSNGVTILRMASEQGDERAAQAYDILTQELEASGDVLKAMEAVEEFVKGPETAERIAVEVVNDGA